jgi:diacylglycerol O-acyltransferase / wax synthase
MDRPNNLMVVHGLLWLSAPPDWDEVERVIRERLVERFPVFHRRAAERDGRWRWEDDPDFSLDHHIRRVRLPEPGTADQASDYVSARASQPLDRAHSLWEADFIDGVRLPDGSEGAIMFNRFHHSIADGIRLVQVSLSLLDPLTDGPTVARVGRGGGSGGGAGDLARALARTTAASAADVARGLGSAVAHAPARLTAIGPQDLVHGLRWLRQPGRMFDEASLPASDDNAVVNTARSVGRIAVATRSLGELWSGAPGIDKRITWMPPVPLAEVKQIGRQHGVTVNDVLLAAVSLGFTDYLADHGITDVDQVTWLVPVALKQIDDSLPGELGNHFAVVQLPMVLGERDTDVLVHEMHTRMKRIKNSAEPQILSGVQRVIAETPPSVSVPLTNFVANKGIGQLTNVPGPAGPMALAGTEVTSILGLVPTTGDQPLGLCIFSYNGTVTVGIFSDAVLVKDPGLLGDHIAKAIPHLGESGS